MKLELFENQTNIVRENVKLCIVGRRKWVVVHKIDSYEEGVAQFDIPTAKVLLAELKALLDLAGGDDDT